MDSWGAVGHIPLLSTRQGRACHNIHRKRRGIKLPESYVRNFHRDNGSPALALSWICGRKIEHNRGPRELVPSLQGASYLAGSQQSCNLVCLPIRIWRSGVKYVVPRSSVRFAPITATFSPLMMLSRGCACCVPWLMPLITSMKPRCFFPSSAERHVQLLPASARDVKSNVTHEEHDKQVSVNLHGNLGQVGTTVYCCYRESPSRSSLSCPTRSSQAYTITQCCKVP